MLRGLRSAPELNDEVGMVCGFEAETVRYLVQILPDVGLRKLKRENLLVMEVPEMDGGGPQAGSAGASAGGGAASSSSSSAPPPPPFGDAAFGEDDSDMADAFKDCMPLFHDAIWSATALDVEYTLGTVIHKVLRDMSVDKKVRRQRADALLRLGNMMQAPMRERQQRAAAAGGSNGPSSSAPLLSSAAAAAATAGAGVAAATSKKSVLARFKPHVPWRPRSEQRTQKAREQGLKQKRMEAALAMMAAGASTEDVDEMAAARAAMEAEDCPRGP